MTQSYLDAREGITMSDKSPQKDSAKKTGKTLKEKRAQKKAKKDQRSASGE